MSGRTMVRCSVGIDYFPPRFFLPPRLATGRLAAFLAVDFLAARLAAFFAGARFAAALAGAAFLAVAFLATGRLDARGGASVSSSVIGSSPLPSAALSMSTTSDQRM